MAKVKIQGHASGTGVLTVTAPNTSTDRTITLPDETATLSTFNPDGAVTINESSADVDFRVESDNDANALFVQGSDGNVGIGISTPTNPLTVEGDGARIAFSNTATYPCLGGISAFRSGTSHGNMYIETAGGSNFNTPVERIAIEGTTGEVKISTGDLIFGTAGKGIVLGSTSNTNANTLDDYEEGTWTPVLGGNSESSQSYSSRVGRYTKIGNMVFCHGHLALTAEGSISGFLRIKGFPFTVTPTNAGAASFAYSKNVYLTADHVLEGWVYTTNVIYLYETDFNNEAPSQIGSGSCNDTTSLSFSFFFTTTD